MVRLSAFSDEAGESLAEQIRALCENGLAYTDLRNVDGVNVLQFTTEDAKAYERALRDAGIAVSCIGSPLGKRDACDFAELRQDLDKILRLNEIFACDKVRMFSFYRWQGQEERILACLAEAVEYAARRGVKLYHENELGIFGESPETCRRIVEETHCGCIFDSANFVLSGYEITNAERVLLPLSDFYHVKDGKYSGEIVPAGYGDGNLESLLSHDGVTLTVEPHLFEFGGLGNLIDHGLKKTEFVYTSPRQAFDAGVAAVKAILDKNRISYE